MSAQSGPPGTTVAVTAACTPATYQDWAILLVSIYSPTDPSLDVYNENGDDAASVTTDVTVPSYFPDGTYTVSASCDDYAAGITYADQTFTVTGSSLVPGAPTGLTAVPGAGSVTLAWSPPPADGVPVSGYVITPYLAGVAESPVDVGDVTSDVLTGLSDGRTYTFAVAAVNADGTGLASAPSAPVVVGSPLAPTALTVTPASGQVTLKWKVPGDNGSKVTGYVITSYVGGAAQTPKSIGKATSEVLTGLADGTSYAFTVAAVNSEGTGPATARTTAVDVGAPLAPKAPKAKVKEGGLTLTWKAPADGGSAILDYVVTPYVGSVAQTAIRFASTATSEAIGGLTTGTKYTFTVAAGNTYGTGQTSPQSVEVTAG